MSNQSGKYTRRYTRLLQGIVALFITMILWACANIGSPEGGPFDVTPPRLISAKPNDRATRVESPRIDLTFDEFIKLSQQEKVIISPPQSKQPLITARGKSVHIRLLDSLRPNTTYSIYFDDAIVDNNEDNPLEDFGYTFSTGDAIDTMQIRGKVIDAETLEPIGNVLVGAHTYGRHDSIVLREVFSYASKTNKQGIFTIRGLRDSVYQIYALDDKDNDLKYDGLSEGFAFARNSYRTSKLDSIKTDTIKIDSIVRRDTLYRDSLVTYPHTYYYPNDVVLRYFQPENKQRGLQRTNREDSLHFSLEFAEQLRVAPELHSLDRPNASQSLYLTSLNDRVATYWLKDSLLISQDSIRFSITYTQTDSLLQEYAKTDTLTFYKPKPKKAESKEKISQNPFSLSFAGATGIRASTPEDSLILTASLPVNNLTPEAIRLEVTQDSVFKALPFTLQADSLNPLRYSLHFERNYGANYRVRIDSAAIRSIYGHVADSVVFTQSTSPEGELGALRLSIEGIQGRAFVQLLNKSDQVLLTQEAIAPKDTISTSDSLAIDRPLSVTFSDLKPEEYYLRMFVDLDSNGQWTTGSYPDREPEPMYYSPSKYPVKKSFTTDERWIPTDTPLDKQKPLDLLKAKPEAIKKREDKNKEYYKRMNDKKRK